MKSFQSLAVVVCAVCSFAASATTSEIKNGTSVNGETRGMVKYKVLDESFELNGKINASYEDYIRLMRAGNQVTEYDSLQNGYLPLQEAELLAVVARDAQVTEYEAPEVTNLTIVTEEVLPQSQLQPQGKF